MPVFLVYFALLAVLFFFLIVRPQRRQLAARRALIAAVGIGDEVITAGGIYGTVRAIDGDVLKIEVADGVVLSLAREAIARRRGDEPAADASGAESATGSGSDELDTSAPDAAATED
jgi:preprotein translocase subunit YajC